MNTKSSGYKFPIFISSTHYDLIDLRAELSSHLSMLGYTPIVSSEAGFPDNTPKLTPWESCLPVLSTCFVMILVIDSKYGFRLKWENYKDIMDNEDVAPTHAEYRFAHKKGIRLLVFIRKEMMAHYQSFRRLLNEGKTDEQMKELLGQTLPKRISYDVLKFIHEVKTSSPIPWIKEFEDVTEVKFEVQSKLTNELAEVFLLREKHKTTLIKKLNEYLASKPKEEQIEILNELDIKNELIEQINQEKQKTKELTAKLESIKDTEKATADFIEKQLEEQHQAIQKLMHEIDHYKLTPSDVKGIEFTHVIDQHCNTCGCIGKYNCVDESKGEIRTCPNCGLSTCKYCMNGEPICPKCKSEESLSVTIDKK